MSAIRLEKGTQTPISKYTSSAYIKSCSQTRIASTTIEHTWEIEQFLCLSDFMETLISPPFSEENKYKIQINFPKQNQTLQETHDRCGSRYDLRSSQPTVDDTIKFFILTSEAFRGLCTITISCLPEKVLSTFSISGTISNMTLLIKISKSQFKYTDLLTIHCKCVIFHKLIDSTLSMKLLPSSTVFSRDVKYLESLYSNSISEDKFESKDDKTIKFIVGKEQYVISKELLLATNSSYFKNICLKQVEKEKDMTNELMENDELEVFKKILLFIINKSIEQYDEDILKKLLKTADKYDVAALKLTCEHYLLRRITIENATELMQLAFCCNANFLQTLSAEFIKFHVKEITDVEEFENSTKILKQEKDLLKSEQK